MKQLIQNITTSIPFPRALARRLVFLLAVLLVGVGNMWGKTWYATAYVEAIPNSGGYVKVISQGLTYIDENVSASSISSSSDHKTNTQYNWSNKSGDVDFSAYANDASLKGEFIRTVHADSGLSDTDAAEIVRCGLRVLSGEEVFES